MNIRQMVTQGTQILMETSIECADVDAKLLAQHVLGYSYTKLTVSYNEEASEDIYNKYMEMIEKRSSHYPCQYIIGTQYFMGYEFKVSENVLIPRPETEILVETALKEVEAFSSEGAVKALDMCCGSGCIGLSFDLCRRQSGYMKDEVTLADISDYALSLTKTNAQKYNLDCNVVKTDLFEEINDKYNIIMSNPPYIRSHDVDELMDDVRLFEPRLALDGKEDGLYFYDKIIKEAGKYLYEDGIIIFEIGYDQAEDIRSLLVENNFSDIEIIKDYSGLNRIVKARFRRI